MGVMVEAVGFWGIYGFDTEVSLLLKTEWLSLRSRSDMQERSRKEEKYSNGLDDCASRGGHGIEIDGTVSKSTMP